MYINHTSLIRFSCRETNVALKHRTLESRRETSHLTAGRSCRVSVLFARAPSVKRNLQIRGKRVSLSLFFNVSLNQHPSKWLCSWDSLSFESAPSCSHVRSHIDLQRARSQRIENGTVWVCPCFQNPWHLVGRTRTVMFFVWQNRDVSVFDKWNAFMHGKKRLRNGLLQTMLFSLGVCLKPFLDMCMVRFTGRRRIAIGMFEDVPSVCDIWTREADRSSTVTAE